MTVNRKDFALSLSLSRRCDCSEGASIARPACLAVPPAFVFQRGVGGYATPFVLDGRRAGEGHLHANVIQICISFFLIVCSAAIVERNSVSSS